MGLPAPSSSATISSMSDEQKAQVTALRELADSIEKGKELPRAARDAVRRIVALAQVRADVREWHANQGHEQTISAAEVRKLLEQP